ncbi:MAG: RluA family pseudouridine synthase [Candidatus Uhrbacteria bacterium]|nr:RluA family pseudouridine synthase [Candidatus Uhrbacteria bacterium]
MPKFIIADTQSKKRIDQILVEVLNISREKIQALIKAGEVTINDKVPKPHTPAQLNDVVVYPKISTKLPKQEVSNVEIPILYEDDDLVVINKPAGLIVHRTNEIDVRPSVVDTLLKKYKGMKKIGDNPLRPGIVQRLDREVSGVMVVAKTQAMFEDLKKQFQDRTVEKNYTALVYGKLPKEHDSISFAIARSKSQGRMVARTGEQAGKDALTEWDVVDRFKNVTLVNVKIHTGRTHQIRVHFLAVDHPIVGDRLYRKKSMRHVKEKNLGRLFLHANSLVIHLADGKKKTVKAPLPKELKMILDALPRK